VYEKLGLVQNMDWYLKKILLQESI